MASVNAVRFAQTGSECLRALAAGDKPFAAATCAVIDLYRGRACMLFFSDGAIEFTEASGAGIGAEACSAS